jgi:hypothetical protein
MNITPTQCTRTTGSAQMRAHVVRSTLARDPLVRPIGPLVELSGLRQRFLVALP